MKYNPNQHRVFKVLSAGTIQCAINNEQLKAWEELGGVIVQSLDIEVGAGAFHPATFLHSIKKRQSLLSFTFKSDSLGSQFDN